MLDKLSNWNSIIDSEGNSVKSVMMVHSQVTNWFLSILYTSGRHARLSKKCLRDQNQILFSFLFDGHLSLIVSNSVFTVSIEAQDTNQHTTHASTNKALQPLLVVAMESSGKKHMPPPFSSCSLSSKEASVVSTVNTETKEMKPVSLL